MDVRGTMEVFQQEIQDLITHSQKTKINFNLVYKNAMRLLNSQESIHEEGQHRRLREIVRNLMKSWKSWIGLIMILSALLIYLQFEVINTHATAIGRILMIQALPFYDWRPLKRERCLIKRNALFAVSNGIKNTNVETDCNYCDGINSVPKFQYIPEDVSNNMDDTTNKGRTMKLADEVKRYYDIDAPVIISNTSDTIYNYDDIKNDLDYNQYTPCNVESNVYFRTSATIGDIFAKLDEAPFYFAHWRNCNLYAMKLFRRFFPRPDYLHVNFSPIQQSWLILSKNYYSGNQKYKQLKLTDRLAIIGIVKGRFSARLTPIRYCYVERMCDDIVVDLHQGDALIISDQWDIHYLFTDSVMNMVEDSVMNVSMAFILEAH